MKDQTAAASNPVKLQPYLSPLAVWALSVGSAIGWGSLVVTSRSYLSQAGPMGSILGLLIGFAIMLMVSSLIIFWRTVIRVQEGCTTM